MSGLFAKRRAAVAEEVRAEKAAIESETAALEEAALAARDDAEILQELDLPEPEELENAEAVRKFMASAVPQRLKTRALRRLWNLNPVLANLDGLVDYGEDFTDSATVIENLQTAYQVGKGMLRHVEELAKADAEKADDKEDVAVSETQIEPDEPVAPAPVRTLPTEVTAVHEDSEPTLPDVTKRRMQFSFEEQA